MHCDTVEYVYACRLYEHVRCVGTQHNSRIQDGHNESHCVPEAHYVIMEEEALSMCFTDLHSHHDDMRRGIPSVVHARRPQDGGVGETRARAFHG